MRKNELLNDIFKASNPKKRIKINGSEVGYCSIVGNI